MIAWLKRIFFNIVLRLLFRSMWSRQGLTVEFVRRRSELLGRLSGHGEVCGRVERFDSGLEGEWFSPEHYATPQRTVLYLHGGAFILFPKSLYRLFAAGMAKQLGADVFLPDYRLAPEHPYPAAPDDCLTAYRHVLSKAESAANVVIAGDSAGGNLAIVTLLRARDEALPLPACAFMMSPLTDFTFSGGSVVANARRDAMFSPAASGFVRGNYFTDPAQANEPWASPLFANLRGLPPVLLHVSDAELLLDDSRRFVERIREAGGQAEINVWHGLPHCFQLSPILSETRPALAEFAAFVDRHASS